MIYTTWRRSTPLPDIPNLEFVELSVDVSHTLSERVEEIFNCAGALSITILSTDDETCFDVAEPGNPQWNQQTLTALFDSGIEVEAVAASLENTLGNTEIRVSILQDRDWERVCLEHYRPFNVGSDLWVCPSWYSPRPDSGTVVEIDPGMAFGTGSHETTRLCLEYLSRLDLAKKTVIDFGCGSGILGIAASKLGASFVTGLDIDDGAVQVANENADKNNVSNKCIALHTRDFFDKGYKCGPVDLVIANILANTLVELSDKICSLVSCGGLLMLSGILQSQVNLVSSAYAGVFEFDIHEDQDWVLLAGFKKL